MPSKNPHILIQTSRLKLAQKFIANLKNIPQDRQQLERALRNFCLQEKISILRNDELVAGYRKSKIQNSQLEKLFRKRGIRSESGVNVVAILTKPLSCPGKCIYCPTPKNMPKSYLPTEPAVLRAVRVDFSPRKQILARLQSLEATGHDASKIELIVMGGTWSAHSHDYQSSYIRACYSALNNSKKPQSLAISQKQNEKSKHRAVGLTLETRPDYITPDELRRMREFGCTRVEIGVQTIYDDIHRLCQRGHGVAEIKTATRLLREAGFKITYHMMLNLPGSNPSRDVAMFEQLFTDPELCPDQIKIYPCVLTADSELEKWYKSGKWKPYSDKVLVNTLVKIKVQIPEWVRVIRVIRDIPATDILAGSKVSNLRQILQENQVQCRCIRCREIRTDIPQNPKLIIRKFRAGEGEEVFLSFEDKSSDKIIALARLYLAKKSHRIFPTLDNSAILRELHVYGEHTSVGRKSASSQHTGFGRKLLAESEKIARESGFSRMAIISGVGVRGYYRKFGYKLDQTYMVKNLA